MHETLRSRLFRPLRLEPLEDRRLLFTTGFDFTATLPTVSGTPFGEAAEDIQDETVTGSFRYETSTPDTNAAADEGDYPHFGGGGAFEVTLPGGTVITGSGSPTVAIENDLFGADRFSYRDGPVGFNPVAALMFVNGVVDPTARLQLGMNEATQSAIDDASLPDPFTFTIPVPFPTITHTFDLNNDGGTILFQFTQIDAACGLDVENTNDSGPGSLRDAVTCANSLPGHQEIVFDALGPGPHTIDLTSGQLSITDTVTITGPGQDDLIIDAQQNSRIIDASTGNPFDVTISSLTLTGGQTPANEGGGSIRFGFFGSDNTGTLSVTSSTISGNSATGQRGDGGGIYTRAGSVSVTSSTISGNSATGQRGDGGGIYTFSGSVSVTSSAISGNSASDDGGGISTEFGSVSVTSSTISGNSAGDDGGGIFTYSGSVSVTSSTISGNSAGDEGGGIFTYSGSVSVTSSTISGNSAGDDGGGIYTFSGSVSVTSSTISGNSAGAHGGIYIGPISSESVVFDSIVAGNSASIFAPDFQSQALVRTFLNSLLSDNTDSNVPQGGTNIVGTGALPVNAMLGPLANNGGPTQTHALLPGSPAIDAVGSPGVAAGVLADSEAEFSGVQGQDDWQYGFFRATIDGPSYDVNGVDDFMPFGIGVFQPGSQLWDVSAPPGTPITEIGATAVHSAVAGEHQWAIRRWTSDVAGTLELTWTLRKTNTGGGNGVTGRIFHNGTEVDSAVIAFDDNVGVSRTVVLPNVAIGATIDIAHDPVGIGGALDDSGDGSAMTAVIDYLDDQRGLARPQDGDGNGTAIADIGAFELGRNFVVNSIADGADLNPGDGICADIGGGCNLQAAIEETNALSNVGGIPDTIFFDIAGSGPHVISVLGALPNLTDPVIIDGTSEPDFDMATHQPVVEVNGTNAGVGASGFTISGGGGGSVIRGLAINRFDAHGIFVSRRDNVTVEHNFIGTDPGGTMDRGNGGSGVQIINAENTVVRHNTISGNGMFGVNIEGTQSTANIVAGNLIGTTADGSGEPQLKNTLGGVQIAAAFGNTVGGSSTADRNVIGGGREGVAIRGETADGNMVIGNFIGTDATGTSAIRNTRGVHIVDGDNNTVGGAGGAANVISGNTKGVEINRGSGNLVHGNLIGTDAAGTAALANVRGLLIRNAANNQIGNEPNVISGNTREGVKIFGASSTGNVVRDNRIGTNLAGDTPIANREGVIITSGAEGNTIGGTTAAERNVISGNTTAGVFLLADNNSVTGNLIGTDLAGTAAIPNDTGIFVRNASGNTIGGSVSGGESNLISGNDEQGVLLTGNNVANTTIAGNAIGTNLAGTAAVANKHGVRIENGAHTIGGATADDGNVISGNSSNGVYIIGAGADGNLLQNNRLGVNIDGSGAVPNVRSGVLIENAPNNMVGNAAAGNSIGGNAQQGVKISGASATGNLVQNNAIGQDGLTMTQIGNRDGIRISDGASGNTVGGNAATTANEIAHNTGRGVWISGGTANIVSQNSIHDNGALGISIGAQSATPNDPDTGSGADADTGANNLQNTPDLTTVALSAGNLSINYSMSSAAANSGYPITVEFFLADASGEGGTFLGTDNIAGPGADTANIPAGPTAVGSPIVATATDNNGNTSEFSAAVNVAAPLRAAGGVRCSTLDVRCSALAPALTDAQLSQVAGIAIARLSQLGLSADLFSNVSYAITDLPGNLLGLATPTTITIDTNAANHGWRLSQETRAKRQAPTDSGSRLSTLDSRLEIDLLTTVMHELGHVAGLEDLHHEEAQDDLMYAWLAPGEQRKSLNGSLADKVFGEL
jgi:hypothetical protein